MYENATTLKFRPGKLAEGLTILREEIFPILLKQPGLIHLGQVPGQHEDKVSVISLWGRREDALALEHTCAYLRAISKLDPLLVMESTSDLDQPNPLRKLAVQIPLN